MATILATGAAIAALGGCGGNDAPIQSITTTGSESTAASALSQEDFISGADSRCAEANSAIGGLGTDTSADAVGQQLEITQEILSGIQALGPPTDSTGDLASFFRGLKQQISVLKQQQTALSSGDTATAASLSTQLDQAESETQAAAASYGFDACSQPPSASTSTGGTATTPPAPAVTTSTTPVAPVVPAPEPTPASPTGGTGAGTPTPVTPVTPPDDGGGTSSGGGGLSP